MVVLVVQGGVEGDRNEGCRPDTVGRVDNEATSQACQTIANEVGRQRDQDLVAKGPSERLVKELRQDLRPDDVLRVGDRLCRVGHDGNQHVLFLVEAAGVQVVTCAKESETPVGYHFLPCFA